jgi:O-antigen ligase
VSVEWQRAAEATSGTQLGGSIKVLRISLPIAQHEVPPRIHDISRRLPGVLLALWVLTLPLEFTKLYFPNQAIEVSRIVLVLCLLTFLAQVVIERRSVRVPASPALAALTLFIAFAGVSSVVIGSTSGMKTAAVMAAYLLMLLTIFNWTDTFSQHRRIWSCFVVSAVVVSVVGLVFHATNFYFWNEPNVGFARVNSTFRDPNIFARFLAFAIVTMIVLTADLEVTRRRRIVWVAGALAAALALPFTYSRAGWALTVVVALVAVALVRHRSRALALVALVVAVFAVVAVIDPSVLNRAAQLAANLKSPFTGRPWLGFLDALPLDSVRRYLIGTGLAMFADHPIAGIGFGNFSRSLAGGAYAGMLPVGATVTESHTALITILAETGLVGFVLVLLAGFFFVREMIGSRMQAAATRALVLAPAIGVLVTVLDSQSSGRLLDESYLWLFLGLAYAARLGLDGGSATSPKAARSERA